MSLNKLYQDWGKTLKNKSRPKTAVEYLNKSLNMKKNNTTALLTRSYAKLKIADVDGALKDATTARSILTIFIFNYLIQNFSFILRIKTKRC